MKETLQVLLHNIKCNSSAAHFGSSVVQICAGVVEKKGPPRCAGGRKVEMSNCADTEG